MSTVTISKQDKNVVGGVKNFREMTNLTLEDWKSFAAEVAAEAFVTIDPIFNVDRAQDFEVRIRVEYVDLSEEARSQAAKAKTAQKVAVPAVPKAPIVVPTPPTALVIESSDPGSPDLASSDDVEDTEVGGEGQESEATEGQSGDGEEAGDVAPQVVAPQVVQPPVPAPPKDVRPDVARQAKRGGRAGRR